MPDDNNVRVNNNSNAVGNISAGGDISGNIHVGNIGYSSEDVAKLLTQITSTFQPKPFDGTCPYKGLDVFEEEDAELFFGREKLVEELVGKVKASRTVFITGPSGSGKSSLVRAGLIPALKQGQIKGSERWLYATMKPGRDPFEALAVVFSRLKSPELGKYFREHSHQPAALNECAESALSEQKDQLLVLFIDQFEEIFTQFNKEEERIAFLNLLTHATEADNGRVILLFSMRSDFVPNCAMYPELNAALNRQFIQIGGMQPDELVSAIAQPALQVGLKIEPELIAQIIADMKGEPGALPLMQFALKDLFDSTQASGGVIALTLGDYLKRGGVQKSLERHADTAFSNLGTQEQEVARGIFSGLIEVGRGTQDTKRTAILSELVPPNVQVNSIKVVVRKLADARLVTTDDQIITISHEKLIDAWPWLRKLVNENREVIQLQNQITEDAKTWEENRRDASYLYSGARLASAQEELRTQQLRLGGIATEFIKSGISKRQRERHTRIFAIAAVIGLLFGGVGLFSYISTNNANQLARQSENFAQTQAALANEAQANADEAQANANEAIKQAAIVRSQILTLNAQESSDIVLRNLLLSIEAFNLVKTYPFPDRVLAEQRLHDSLSQVGGIPLLEHERAANSVVFSPDGEWLATAGDDKTVHLMKVDNSSEEPIILTGPEYAISVIIFSPDGKWLASGDQGGGICLWSMDDLSADPIILETNEIITNDTLAFSPDGKWLAAAGGGYIKNVARLWNMNDLSAPPIDLPNPNNFIYYATSALKFSPDGKWLAANDFLGITLLWNMSDVSAPPAILDGIESSDGLGIRWATIAFSPDSEWLAASGEGTTILLWRVGNLSSGPVRLKESDGPVYALTFSPDGKWLAASNHGTSRVWNMDNLSTEPIVLSETGSPAYDNLAYSNNTLAFSQDGQWLATGGENNTARLWSVKKWEYYIENPNLKLLFFELKGHEDAIITLDFSPNGNWLATGSIDGATRLWNAHNPSANSTVFTGYLRSPAYAYSPNGEWLAIEHPGNYNVVQLWKVNDPLQEPVELEKNRSGDIIETMSFSPDGKWLAIGDSGTTIYLWSMNNLSAGPVALKEGRGIIWDIAFSPDGKWMAATSQDNNVRLWNTSDLSADAIILNGYEKSITALAFSPDDKWLATGSGDNTIRVWKVDAPTAQPIILKKHEFSVDNLSFSPDGKWLASSDSNNAYLWKINGFTIEPVILTPPLAFSSNGEWMAGENKSTTLLWEVSDLTVEPIVLKGNEDDNIKSFAFSSNGEWLATSTWHGKIIRLWNIQYPSSVPIVLQGPETSESDIAFIPDSEWLLSLDNDIVFLRSLNTDRLLETACKVVGRNFTREEWRDYFPNEEYRKTCEQWPLEPDITLTPTATP